MFGALHIFICVAIIIIQTACTAYVHPFVLFSV